MGPIIPRLNLSGSVKPSDPKGEDGAKTKKMEKYRAFEGECTFDYIGRIMDSKSDDPGLEFINMMGELPSNSVEFEVIMKNLPSVRISDSYKRSSLLEKCSYSIEKLKMFVERADQLGELNVPEKESINKSLNEFNYSHLNDSQKGDFAAVSAAVHIPDDANYFCRSVLKCSSKDYASNYAKLKSLNIPMPALWFLSKEYGFGCLPKIDDQDSKAFVEAILSRMTDSEIYELVSLGQIDDLKALLTGEDIKSQVDQQGCLSRLVADLPDLGFLNSMVKCHRYDVIESILTRAVNSSDPKLLSYVDKWKDENSFYCRNYQAWEKAQKEGITYSQVDGLKSKLVDMATEIINNRNLKKEEPAYRRGVGSNKPFAARQSTDDTMQRKELKKLFAEYLDRCFDFQYTCKGLQIQESPCKIKEDHFVVKLRNPKTGRLDTYRITKGEHTPVIYRNDFEKLSMDTFGRGTLFGLLATAFSGDQVEVVTKTTETKVGDEFWNDWEVRVDTKDGDYSTIIRPWIRQALLEILQTQNLKNPVILEICAGKGDLAVSVLQETKKLDMEVDYTLLEFNEPSIEAAREKLKDEAIVVQTDIVNDDEYYVDKEKTEPFEEGSVDVVVGSGALTAVVLEDKKAALKALSKISKYLKPGGHLILSGRADSLLHSRDFAKAGYEVLNTSIPVYMKHFYLLRKTEISSRASAA